MPVYRRSDRKGWEVVVRFNGQRVRRSSQEWTRAQAREVERQILDQLKNPDRDRTFAEAIEVWIATELPRLKSAKQTHNHLLQIAHHLEGRTLKEAPAIATRIKADLIAQGRKPATINRKLAMLKRLTRLAYREWGWLSEPVHTRISLLREDNERHVYYTPKQVEALAAKMPRSGDYVVLAAYTGLRKSQLLRLSTEANVRGEYFFLGIDTKNGRPQLLPIHERVEQIAQNLPIAGVTPQILRSEWEAARKACGLPDAHFHDLRHTLASWLIQSGAGLKHVKEALNHRTVQTTQRYAHLEAEHLKGVFGRISGGVSPRASTKEKESARRFARKSLI